MILALIFTLILCELLLVGWVDIKSRRISNYWILVNVILSIIFHVTLPGLYPLSWELLLFPFGFIVIGFFLFLLGVMGAGDSKFLASLFLVIPLEYQMMFFEKLILSTIVTGFILLSLRVVRNRALVKSYFWSQYWSGMKEAIKSKFSYAPVLVVAWILLGFNLWR